MRTNTNYNSPVTDLKSNDLRCNVGASSGGGSTTTVSIAAGSTVTFTADVAVYHQGPVAFYLSKVQDANAADGSGDWAKIKEIGPSFSGGQAKWDMSRELPFCRRLFVHSINPVVVTYSVQLPSCISPGEYLLRIEQLGIHNPGGAPQFYIGCAQLKVTGGGSGTLSPSVKIPGHVKATDSGYTANIYNNFKSYVVPGPKVATY